MYVALVAATCIGFTAGAFFYHWWARPDVQDLKKRIEHLEHEKHYLSKMAMRTFTVTRTKVNIDTE
jgi:hypothetical protein